MALSQPAVILEPRKIKSVTTSSFSLCLSFLWLSFFNVEFQASFFTLFFHSYHEALSSSSLSAIRVVSSAYLRLLLFLLAILIPACDASSPACHMICSVLNLNKQGNSIQPCCTPFTIWSQSVVPCKVLTIAYWLTYRFLRRQVMWSGTPHVFKTLHSLLRSTPSALGFLWKEWC